MSGKNLDEKTSDGRKKLATRSISGLFKLTNMRLHVALLLCFSVFSNNMMRTNLSMAMVCMVNSTALALEHEDSAQFLFPTPGGAENKTTVAPSADDMMCKLPTVARREYEGSFAWTSDEQAMVFAALFWGGLLSGFPAGWLADRYGPKNILLGSVLSNIVGSLLSPIAAERGGHIAFFVIRFIMGIGQGLQYPCIASLMSKWFPPEERSTVIAIYTAGNQMGQIITLPLGAWLCEQKQFLNGWPSLFYTAGVVSLIWCVLWAIFSTNSPEKNRKISRVESHFILEQLQSQSLQNRKAATKKVPWLSMITSVPLWANMAAMFTANVVMNVISSYLPTYFKEVLLLDIKSNGLYSALPFVVQWVMKMTCSYIADALKKKTNISHSRICKAFQVFGNFGSSITVIGLCFVTCLHPGIAIALLCGTCFFMAGNIPGFMTSSVSIAPQYSGIVNSFTRIAGQMGSLGGPYLIGFITTHGAQSEWRTVFIIIAVLDVLTGVIYLFFSSAEIQEWAKIPVSKQSQIPLCVTKSSAQLVSGERSDANFETIPEEEDIHFPSPKSNRGIQEPVRLAALPDVVYGSSLVLNDSDSEVERSSNPSTPDHDDLEAVKSGDTMIDLTNAVKMKVAF